MDICGPIQPESLGGRIFEEILCAAPKVTRICVASSEGLREPKLKRIRVDNAKEFQAEAFKRFCADNGIKHESIVPYCPASNGVVERAHSVLLSLARSMLMDADLPSNF